MERLTQKDAQGFWSLKGVKWDDISAGKIITEKVWERLYGALWKLMDYEEAEPDPEKVAELAERDTAKMPEYEGDGYADGEIVYDIWICPNCEEEYEVDYDDYNFCPNCGQRIKQ